MFRKVILFPVVLIGLVLSLAACGPAGSSDETKAADKAPVSLNGTWKADGFDATVSDNSIEVNIVDDKSETSSLYWKGTFPVGSDKVVSEADTEALASSMLGSQDDTKEFTVKDDEISFKITIMGTSKVVHLKKA
jgi:hypothetical protein